MSKVFISDEAYTEFVDLLKQNNIDNYSIRINFAGNGCSGPRFNIIVDEPKESDIVETIKDIKFMVDKSLIDAFDGFSILSSEENLGRGMTLLPLTAPESDGCGTCGGCH